MYHHGNKNASRGQPFTAHLDLSSKFRPRADCISTSTAALGDTTEPLPCCPATSQVVWLHTPADLHPNRRIFTSVTSTDQQEWVLRFQMGLNYRGWKSHPLSFEMAQHHPRCFPLRTPQKSRGTP